MWCEWACPRAAFGMSCPALSVLEVELRRLRGLGTHGLALPCAHSPWQWATGLGAQGKDLPSSVEPQPVNGLPEGTHPSLGGVGRGTPGCRAGSGWKAPQLRVLLWVKLVPARLGWDLVTCKLGWEMKELGGPGVCHPGATVKWLLLGTVGKWLGGAEPCGRDSPAPAVLGCKAQGLCQRVRDRDPCPDPQHLHPLPSTHMDTCPLYPPQH